MTILCDLRTHIIICIMLCFAACRKPKSVENPLLFNETPVSVPVTPGVIDEASGISDSKANPGYLWVLQDSGNPPGLHLLSTDGTVAHLVHIKGAGNRDWEDLVLAPGPDAGINYLYVGDFGDNNQQHETYNIYRFPEPALTTDTVFTSEMITFRYPDGAHDAEAILADLDSKDLYIITKRDQASIVYKLTYPHQLNGVQTVLKVATLPFSGVVSAAISPDNKEVLVKTYLNMYHWTREEGKTLEEIFIKAPATVSYKPEPQGEAVCFRNDNAGFYTLSEKGLSIAVALNFYRRN